MEQAVPANTIPDMPAPKQPAWQQDVNRAGWVRQLIRARHWYGADWYLAAISIVLLSIFLIIALFPQFIAPYSPTAEAGHKKLAPGEIGADFVMAIKRTSNIKSLLDIGSSKSTVGLVRGSESSKALRDEGDKLTQDLHDKGQDVTIRPDRQLFDSLDEAIAALDKGDLDAVIEDPTVLAPALKTRADLTTVLLSKSNGQSFLLGTNQLGQDLFSRLIWGARIALFVGLASAVLATVIGVPMGLLSGYVGGWLDRALTLLMDSLYSFPGLILAISIAAVLGPGVGNVIMAIAVLYIPTYYRVVRGQTLTAKQELYVEAAQSLGANRFSILAQYIFPNVLSSIVVLFSVNVADAILTEAGLSFLGLGLPPDTPDWGIDLARGQEYIRESWWLIVYPGLAVVMVVLGFSMLGESLSEMLNPRLNRA